MQKPHYNPLPIPWCVTFLELPQPGLGIAPHKNAHSTRCLIIQHSVCLLVSCESRGCVVCPGIPGISMGLAHRNACWKKEPSIVRIHFLPLKRTALNGGLILVPLIERSWQNPTPALKSALPSALNNRGHLSIKMVTCFLFTWSCEIDWQSGSEITSFWVLLHKCFLAFWDEALGLE